MKIVKSVFVRVRMCRSGWLRERCWGGGVVEVLEIMEWVKTLTLTLANLVAGMLARAREVLALMMRIVQLAKLFTLTNYQELSK